MDFDYVVKRQEKSKICFGSGLERKTLDSDVKGLFSKHARKNMKENIITLTPGMYGIAIDKTSVLNRPTSHLGTVIGGRTAERKFFISNVDAPPPGAYEIPSAIPQRFTKNKAPFNSCTSRKPIATSTTPGPGQYPVKQLKCRTIPFAHCFGGRKTVFPAVKMKCGPFNFDTCERCNKAPEGDYWYLDVTEAKKPHQKKSSDITELKKEGTFLCRPCYNIEKVENKIFSKGQMRAFKKIRNCSKVHFHDGCKAKLYLVPPEEIKRQSVREGYLSLFYKNSGMKRAVTMADGDESDALIKKFI